jgi:SAM-dependent methyltransferase
VYQDDDSRELQEVVDRLSASKPFGRVLDAGCGSQLPLDLPQSVHLVGIDESAEALAKNENVDEAIVGDLVTYDFGKASFDAVLCWTVLEHLQRPEAAIQNLGRALRPGGLLIICVPNIWSVKGLITKATPHSFHVWVYKYLYGDREAGKPGRGPYRTYLKLAISPSRLTEIGRANGLELVWSKKWVNSAPDQLPGPLRKTWNGLSAALKLASIGKLEPASDYVAVFRKII